MQQVGMQGRVYGEFDAEGTFERVIYVKNIMMKWEKREGERERKSVSGMRLIININQMI